MFETILEPDSFLLVHLHTFPIGFYNAARVQLRKLPPAVSEKRGVERPEKLKHGNEMSLIMY